jgi:hypothetical protein
VRSVQEGGRFADWIHQFPYKVCPHSYWHSHTIVLSCLEGF